MGGKKYSHKNRIITIYLGLLQKTSTDNFLWISVILEIHIYVKNEQEVKIQKKKFHGYWYRNDFDSNRYDLLQNSVTEEDSN